MTNILSKQEVAQLTNKPVGAIAWQNADLVVFHPDKTNPKALYYSKRDHKIFGNNSREKSIGVMQEHMWKRLPYSKI